MSWIVVWPHTLGCPPDNSDPPAGHAQVFITSDSVQTVQIGWGKGPGLGTWCGKPRVETGVVGPGNPWIVNLCTDLMLAHTDHGAVTNKRIGITWNVNGIVPAPVSVLLRFPDQPGCSDDAYLAIPAERWGSEYFIAAHRGQDAFPNYGASYFTVVAGEPGVQVGVEMLPETQLRPPPSLPPATYTTLSGCRGSRI